MSGGFITVNWNLFYEWLNDVRLLADTKGSFGRMLLETGCLVCIGRLGDNIPVALRPRKCRVSISVVLRLIKVHGAYLYIYTGKLNLCCQCQGNLPGVEAKEMACVYLCG